MQEAGPTDSGPLEDAGSLLDAAPPIGPGASALLLRYDFAGAGTALLDRVGGAHASILGGAQLDGSGRLALDGEDDYVDLPNGLLARLESVTIMVWFEWQGGVCWQRVFDFGNNDAGEGQVGQALAALFFTPVGCGDERSVAMAEFGARRLRAFGTQSFPLAINTPVAVVYDATAGMLRLYQGGALVGETQAAFALSELMDVNNWLGRSQWVQDRFASVRYDEFRLYGAALTSEQIAELVRSGPDAP
jgi:hypothetical protein